MPNAVNPPDVKPRGAFGERAIATHWPSGAAAVPCDTFHDVVSQLMCDEVDAAVLPVFNVIAGNVEDSLAVLESAGPGVTVVNTLDVPIEMCLMAVRGATLDAIRTARSHPIALAQCAKFFAQHAHIVPQAQFDTAGAARDVATLGDISCGAIAGEAAAGRYGLEILARAIQDVLDNWTRFVILVRAT